MADIHLTAPGAAPGLSICFADDYSYDWCDEAIREGYAYQLMAYTGSQYAYFDMVFTGLPQIMLTSDSPIGTQDAPVSVAMSQWGQEAVRASALAHLRGDGSLYNDKKSYKLKFVRSANRTGSAVVSIPEMGETSELILLAMAFDETLMRDRLSWEMAALAPTEKGAFAAKRAQYAEVFVNGAYEGVYLVMTPYDIGGEMRRQSAEAPFTDSLYRTFVAKMSKERPYLETEGTSYELFHAPDEANAFAALEPYLSLMALEDEAFVRAAEECLDLDSALRYALLVQAMALTDNSSNNMYIWARRENGRTRYRFELWDMDLSWDFDPGPECDYWFTLPVHDRAINLDVGGARERLAQLWAQMRENGFTAETVETLTAKYLHELVDSGAHMRNVVRWNLTNAEADSFAIVNCAQMRFEMLDQLTRLLCETDESVWFLGSEQRENGYGVAIGEWLWAQEGAGMEAEDAEIGEASM